LERLVNGILFSQGESAVKRLTTDLLPSRLVKIKMLLLIAACLLCGCGKSSEDGPSRSTTASWVEDGSQSGR
jgi:hypothetical protein